MSWLAQNWFFIAFGLLFIAMHRGHGGHGGDGAARAPLRERQANDEAGRASRTPSATGKPIGHQH